MGYTIEDMLVFSKDQYKMELIGGKKGWSNSISWMIMLEDVNVTKHLAGKELAVTTGIGFASTEKLKELVRALLDCHAAGLIINTGEYIHEIPQEIIDMCDAHDLPLLTVPWEIILAEMIKDITARVFFQGIADERIQDAFIRGIKEPDNQENYRTELLPYFDVDGTFQVALLTTDGLDAMDTVERKRLGYRMQLYLENISHNGCFFYYDSNFVLVMNDVGYQDMTEIIEGMVQRVKMRMPDVPMYVGVGTCLTDISNVALCYERAKAAVTMAYHKKENLMYYDKMGMYRLLYAVKDEKLLQEMGMMPLQVLDEYDQRHNSNYVETLECYLRYDGSIQAVSEAMFTHRNTVIYRINNIKKLLGTNLDSPEERMPYQVAFYIRKMK